MSREEVWPERAGGDPAEDLQEDLVVADMSELAPQRPLLFPVFDAASRTPGAQRQKRLEQEARNASSPDLDRGGLLSAMKGALGASLLIWLVYGAVFGGFIFLLTRIFKLFG